MDCPKCGYKRQPTDATPDDECPKCGVIYAKYIPKAKKAKPTSPPRRGLHPVISLGVIGACILAIYIAGSAVRGTQPISNAKEAHLRQLDSVARKLCFNEIKQRAAFPSTVDISYATGTSSARSGDATLVQADFTATNALGSTLTFQARCKVNDDKTFAFFDIQAR